MGILSDFFSWSKKERLGVVVLSTFLFILFFSDIFFNRIYPFKDYSIHPDTLIVYQQMLEELEAELITKDEIIKIPLTQKREDKVKRKLKPFDPNTVDEDGWGRMGFSLKQSESIIKYRNMLGGFKDKLDLKSSFVIDDEKFKELEPYIQIRHKSKEPIESERKDYLVTNKSLINEALMIDINSADSLSLLQLKGIGPFYSGKIIEYRNQLGGYYSKWQLLEIWNFDSSKLDEIEKQIWVDTNSIHLLSINTDSIHVLNKHPYITWNQAKAMVNYRQQHGKYASKDALLNVVIIDDSLLMKLLPYISLK